MRRYTPGWIELIASKTYQQDMCRLLDDIAEWQRTKGLPDDSIIGPACWAKRDQQLWHLAARFQQLCEATDSTCLQTYGVIKRLMERHAKEKPFWLIITTIAIALDAMFMRWKISIRRYWRRFGNSLPGYSYDPVLRRIRRDRNGKRRRELLDTQP